MQVSDLITLYRGSEQFTPLSGLTELQLVQYVLDKLWAIEVPERIVRPAPYIVTAAGTTAYSFDALVSGVTNIRRIRGLWNPTLTVANLNDYGYRQFPDFDQNLLSKRMYYKGIRLDPENRLLTFMSDPGTTTTAWKLDYYEKAPQVTADSTVPVLPGWELDVVYTGMKAWFEEASAGDSDYWVPLFEAKKRLYMDALRKEIDLPGMDENSYQVSPTHVSPL